MKGFAVVALFVVFVAVRQVSTASTTTHKPQARHSHPHNGTHATQEPHVGENFSFVYRNQLMYIHSGGQGRTCYVATLTADEQVAVHTDSGIRALEIKLLGLLASATPTTKDTLSSAGQHLCGGNRTTSFFTIP